LVGLIADAEFKQLLNEREELIKEKNQWQSEREVLIQEKQTFSDERDSWAKSKETSQTQHQKLHDGMPSDLVRPYPFPDTASSLKKTLVSGSSCRMRRN